MYEEEQALVGVEAWKERTLVDLLHFRRLTKGDNPIFLFLGDGENVTGQLSAEALHRQAGHAAAHLARTLDRGSRVILLFENGLDYIVAFFACLYAGHTPVSGVYPSSIGARERFSFILQDSQSHAVLGKRETLQLFYPDGARSHPIKWVPLESALHAPHALDPVAATPESLALVQYTSGSTEDPKGVCLSHRNICHNIHTQLISFQYQDDDTGLSWLPFTHDMGLVGAVLPALAAGNPFYFMSPDKFIERPARWLDAISRYGATISGGPDFAYRYCARLPRQETATQWDLSRWKIAFNGSENINPETLESFYSKFRHCGFRKESFYACYGLAENALLVTSGVKGEGVRLAAFERVALSEGRALATLTEDAENTVFLSSCGAPHEDQHVHIVDPETSVFRSDGLVGEIWIDSPSVSVGYLNNPLRNALSFVEIEGIRYLRTQDFGFIHQGDLFHVGRMSEKFIHDGLTFYTNDIALSLSQALDSALCLVVPPSLPERDLPTLIIECEEAPDAQHLRAVLFETLKRLRITRFGYYAIRKGYVIRTPSGKLRADLTLDNILSEKSAILFSGDTHAPITTGSCMII